MKIESHAEATGISREMQLLRYGARPRADAIALKKIQALAEPTLDWQRVTELAIAHATLPLLYKNLTLAAPPNIEPALSRIKRYCKLNTIRNLQLTQELQRVLKLLEANYISAIPFKGPSLAALVYGDISLRQFSDLDLLIAEQDFSEARRLLLANRYSHIEKNAALDEAQALHRMQVQGEYPFEHQNGSVTLDLHCRLVTGQLPISTAKLDMLCADLKPVLLLGDRVKTFCPEDLLLYLCVHGAKDFWKKLAWLCDVAALVKSHPQLDWERTIERARSLGCEQILWLGLLLTKDILGLVLPEAIAPAIEANFEKQAALARIRKRLLSGEKPQDIKHFYLERFYFYGQMQATRSEQLRYYWQYAPLFLKTWFLNRMKTA